MQEAQVFKISYVAHLFFQLTQLAWINSLELHHPHQTSPRFYQSKVSICTLDETITNLMHFETADHKYLVNLLKDVSLFKDILNDCFLC